uniref:NADH dehydrogenase subunit 2 n=1 Tax=Labidocera rotunda TaxID=207950 RepID=UPI0020370BE2|nr:NADH dehydrogenase subunit 2 [Labidocera rotunda]URC16616.1 NADH dehydrogenase subunit 2 [Labidocera rotunda]
MLYYNSLLGYLLILVGCVLGALSVESLLLQWVCLEVNMLCIIPVLLGSASEDSIMTGVKYFISQSSASVVFLISIMTADTIALSSLLSMIAILFKLGVPPFHSWMLGIIFSVNFVELLFMLTIQKFIPLIILSQMGVSESLVIMLSVLSMLLIATSMNTNFSFHYMLFLSSVGNGMWMVVSLMTSVWMLFLGFYCVMLSGVILILIAGKLVKFSDVATSDTPKKIMVAMHFFNLGGVPPLMGFAVKLMVLKNLISMGLLICLVLVFMSAMILFIYTSMMYQAFTVSPSPGLNYGGSAGGSNLLMSMPLLLSLSLITWML